MPLAVSVPAPSLSRGALAPQVSSTVVSFPFLRDNTAQRHHPRPQGTRITGAAFTPHHRGITSDERMARRGMLHKLAVECIELRL